MDSPKAKKILIVEDEKPISRSLEVRLRNRGFEISVAADGEAALSNLQKEKFDLIILDLIMPKKDGFAVLAELKTLGIVTPVIVTSNLGQTVDLEHAKVLGASDYFVKADTSMNELVERIEKVLRE